MSEYFNCEKNALVHQFLEVDARITVTPLIDHGKPTISCIKSDIRASCNSEEEKCRNQQQISEKCTFYVIQKICVEIPICFGVEVDVDKGRIRCGEPEFGPCTCRCEGDTSGEVYSFSENIKSETEKKVDDTQQHDNHDLTKTDKYVDIQTM